MCSLIYDINNLFCVCVGMVKRFHMVKHMLVGVYPLDWIICRFYSKDIVVELLPYVICLINVITVQPVHIHSFFPRQQQALVQNCLGAARAL